MVMKYVIDRIVDGTVVLLTLDEPEESLSVSLDNLYPEAAEGDIVEMTDNGFALRADETEKRKKSVESRFNRLAKRRSDR